MNRVVVCGSLNMDVVVQSERRPATGETLLGATVSFLPGGKGLNQAIAAVRQGVPTAMIGAVGNDAFAHSLRSFLADNDVDCSGVPGPIFYNPFELLKAQGLTASAQAVRA